MKQCRVCKQTKLPEQFVKNENRCKACKNKYNKAKPNGLRASTNLKNEIKKRGCQCCQEKCIVCLDFHHKHPDAKEANIAQVHSLEQIIEEVNKCIVLCSNCHRKVHAGLLDVSNIATLNIESAEAILGSCLL